MLNRASFILLLTVLNAPRASAVDLSVMHVNMPPGSNWEVGTTLDSMFRSNKPSPFTRESRIAFQDAYSSAKARESGDFTFETDIMSSMEERIEKLNIDTALKASFMAYSVCTRPSIASCIINVLHV